jgi:hypothetical protein
MRAFTRFGATCAALAFLAASVGACGSDAAEPTESSAQASTLSCPEPSDSRLECVAAMLDQTGAEQTCPVPAGPPPAGMEACTSGLWVPWLGAVGGTFWVCPDSLEGPLWPGMRVGADVTDACLPGSFFVYSPGRCPYGEAKNLRRCGPPPGGGCTGGCIQRLNQIITGH